MTVHHYMCVSRPTACTKYITKSKSSPDKGVVRIIISYSYRELFIVATCSTYKSKSVEYNYKRVYDDSVSYIEKPGSVGVCMCESNHNVRLTTECCSILSDIV